MMKIFTIIAQFSLLHVLLFSAISLAETKFSQTTSVRIEFATKLGKYYQIQVKQGSEWKNEGMAVLGTGEPVVRLFEDGVYRVIEPSKKWVMVWADEFTGKAIDYTKWEKEENNYGGGNNERQAYPAIFISSNA